MREIFLEFAQSRLDSLAVSHSLHPFHAQVRQQVVEAHRLRQAKDVSMAIHLRKQLIAQQQSFIISTTLLSAEEFQITKEHPTVSTREFTTTLLFQPQVVFSVSVSFTVNRTFLVFDFRHRHQFSTL